MLAGASSRVRVAAGCAYAAAGLSVFAWPSPADATPYFQAVGETAVGYSDNVDSSPNTPVAGVSPKVASPFVLIRPGVVFALSTPRTIQRLAYAFTYTMFLNDSSLNSSANRLDYQGFVDVSRSVGLLLNADVLESNTDTATGLGQEGLLPGPTSYFAATSNEFVSFDLADKWRAWQGADVLFQTPLSPGENPQTAAFGGRIGIEHAWHSDALGVEGRVNDTFIRNGLLLDGSPAGPQDQLTSTGVGVWRHDLGQHFTDRIEAGVLRVDRLNTQTGFWSPTGTAVLTYTNGLGQAELSYAHTMTSNPLLGQYLLVDEARLGAALPLVKHPGLLFSASGAYQIGRLLDENSVLAAHLDTLLVDVGFACQVVGPLLLGLRYQYVQRWSDVSIPQLPLSFTRNTVLLSATFKFPRDIDMPMRYRAPQRVDRTDEVRETDEPTKSDDTQ
jgi:hypothetical protein